MRQVQESLHREGRLADLCQCLANEAAYLQKTGKQDSARQTLDRLAQLEAQPAVGDRMP